MSCLYVDRRATFRISGAVPLEHLLVDSTALVEFGSELNTPESILEQQAASIPVKRSDQLSYY